MSQLIKFKDLTRITDNEKETEAFLNHHNLKWSEVTVKTLTPWC